MRIRVFHETRYTYEHPARGLIQVLRLRPRDHDGQYVRKWRIEPSADGRVSEREDGFGNVETLLQNGAGKVYAAVRNPASAADLVKASGGKVVAVELDLATVQTNIVVFRLAPGAPDAATLVARARERGVLLNAFAVRTVRAVTHLDVSAQQVADAGAVLRELLG